MDRGFVTACRARSRSCGFTLKPVRKRVWTHWQPRLATGLNNNVGENQKRKGTALSLTPQGGGDRDWHFTLRDRILRGVCCQWPGGLPAETTGIPRARPTNQGAATAKRRDGTRN